MVENTWRIHLLQFSFFIFNSTSHSIALEGILSTFRNFLQGAEYFQVRILVFAFRSPIVLESSVSIVHSKYLRRTAKETRPACLERKFVNVPYLGRIQRLRRPQWIDYYRRTVFAYSQRKRKRIGIPNSKSVGFISGWEPKGSKSLIWILRASMIKLNVGAKQDDTSEIVKELRWKLCALYLCTDLSLRTGSMQT